MARAFVVLILLGLLAAACGEPSAIDVANAYISAANPSQEVELQADNATKIGADGIEYVGKDRVSAQVVVLWSQFQPGEVVAQPHVEADHVTWTRAIYNRQSGATGLVETSIWVNQARIMRLVTRLVQAPR